MRNQQFHIVFLLNMSGNCSVVRSIVTKVKVTSRDYLPLIGWGDSGLRKGDAHGARGEEGGLKYS